MSAEQWITAAIPTAAVLLAVVRNEFAANVLSSRMSDLERHVFARIDSLEKVMDARFETQKEGTLRIEQVLDARLKHLEEK